MGKKNRKNKDKKQKKEVIYRTKEQRKNEIKEIISKLSEFQLDMTYEPIKQLYEKFKEYINVGNRMEINIPFPEINRRIKGLLAISVREEVWINLKNEKF